MKKLSGYIEFRKEFFPCVGKVWLAYYRGTRNRVTRNNSNIAPRCKQSDLRFDIINNGHD